MESTLFELEQDALIQNDDINFDQIDEDLASFQEDEMVQQALSRGVDLKKYGDDLEKELKKVIQSLFIPFTVAPLSHFLNI